MSIYEQIPTFGKQANSGQTGAQTTDDTKKDEKVEEGQSLYVDPATGIVNSYTKAEMKEANAERNDRDNK